MGEKRSVYISDDTEQRLAIYEHDEGMRSSNIARMVECYVEVCRKHQPDLSVPEWKLICDSLNGYGTLIFDNPAFHVSAFPMNVQDSIAQNRLDQKWDVDGKTLMKKLAALSFAEKLAVCDVAERFWAAVSRGESDPKVPGEASAADTRESSRPAARSKR